MTDAILVLNAGSSSLKFSVFLDRAGATPQLALRGQIEGILTKPSFVACDASGATLAESDLDAANQPGHQGAAGFLLDWLEQRLGGQRLAAAGHRVVHGGFEFSAPVRVSAAVLAALERLVPLAPLHQPHNLAAIRAVAARAPELAQVACFDTAFHTAQPPLAQAYALPRRLTEAGIRRYGFHGLSFEYIAHMLPSIDMRAASGRTVVAHLGNGASMCALLAGKSAASTMGFTALDGLPMGTRCGAIDPGVLLHLLDHHGMDARGLEKLLYHESGLLGVSGISSDVRALLASRDAHAAEAVDLLVYRIVRELGSLAAALGGLDALVFTAGIGENAPLIRARVCRAAAWLGIELDESANAGGGRCISRAGSPASAWVLPTNEEQMIAMHTRAALAVMA
ncbi:MAG: acetate/propionate family kinase [Betaproteobacteria bacterium]|nr:acetate/propionate family kinase [Betaproteobacteria bacterium]